MCHTISSLLCLIVPFKNWHLLLKWYSLIFIVTISIYFWFWQSFLRSISIRFIILWHCKSISSHCFISTLEMSENRFCDVFRGIDTKHWLKMGWGSTTSSLTLGLMNYNRRKVIFIFFRCIPNENFILILFEIFL